MNTNSHFDLSKASFADLPTEILINIFNYLNCNDQEAVSMTCKRWMEISIDYFTKIKISFPKICLSDDSIPGEIFVETFRPHKNLELLDVVLCETENLFEKLGKSLNKISLIAVDLNEKQLCNILNNIEYLNELTLENISSIFMSGQFLESKESQNAIENNFINLKVFSLQNNAYLSDAILVRIVTLIPNLESLDLSDCHIACHNAIQKRFYPQYLENIPSESILTLKYVSKVIEIRASTLTELILSDTLVDGLALSAIATINNLKLKRLILRSCRQLNLNGFQCFVTNQPSIIELDLSNCEGINDSCIELITHLNQLKVLRLKHCWKLTDNATKTLGSLKKLQVLDLSNCVGISSNGIKDYLVKEKNENLNELYLTSIDLYENCVVQCAQNLPNLKVFDVAHCCNGITDKSLSEIIKNQRWLRNLNLQSCHLITDAAITGCNLEDLIAESCSLNENLNKLDDVSNSPSSSFKQMKISLRSKAEQQIVEEAERAKTMLFLLSRNLDLSMTPDSKPISLIKGLEVLNLNGCIKISDISLKYGLKFNELRNLNISNCQQISANGIKCLVNNCNSIEILDLSNCRNLNEDAIDIVNENLKRLKSFNCAGCF